MKMNLCLFGVASDHCCSTPTPPPWGIYCFAASVVEFPIVSASTNVGDSDPDRTNYLALAIFDPTNYLTSDVDDELNKYL